ncbi:MAG: LysM peptidoglycan-binding domain-containing protein, partial [Methylophilaceae bacterium]
MAQTLLNSSGFNQGKLLRALLPFITSALLFTTVILTTPTTFASDENTSAIHTVVAGDTLYKLAQKYLDDAGRWREFLRDNDVKNPLRLVPGSEIRIPQPAPSVTVIFTQGEITLTSANNNAGKPVEVGNKLAEGAVVSVGSNSYLSLQFADGSIVRVLSDSVLRLQKVREVSANSKPKKVSRIMALERGDLDISVTPQKSAGSPKKTKP